MEAVKTFGLNTFGKFRNFLYLTVSRSAGFSVNLKVPLFRCTPFSASRGFGKDLPLEQTDRDSYYQQHFYTI